MTSNDAMQEADLRLALERKILDQGLSLRQVAEVVGISPSTLSRFLRGIGTTTLKNAEILTAYILDKPIAQRKLITQRVVRLNGVKVLVTLELLND
jgi:transcriptional regulator with XRE-family HTH domain